MHTSPYTKTGLTAQQKYKFQVRARITRSSDKVLEDYADSDPVTDSTTNLPPTNLRVTDRDYNCLKVEWNAYDDGNTHDYYLSHHGGQWSEADPRRLPKTQNKYMLVCEL